MQDNISKFHKEAFSTPESFQSDIDDSFAVAPYIRSLRTQGMIIDKHTVGDTRYQLERPILENYLTTLPSKISKRYSPQNTEQNTGAPIPPDPSFMKNDSQMQRIKTIRDLIAKKDNDQLISEKSKSGPVSGVDFARTRSDAALFLKKLGKDVSYEAHHSALKKDDETKNNEPVESRISSSERIVIKQSNVQNSVDFESKIVLNSVPEKNYDNLNLVPIGYENAIDGQIKKSSKDSQIKTNKNFISTSKLNNGVLLKNVLSNDNTTDYFDNDAFYNETNEQSINSSRNQSYNLTNLIEKKMNNSNQQEIKNIEDAPVVIRQVIEDYTKMKEEQKERVVQMKAVENRIQKIVKSELPEEVEDVNETAIEIREIIREVVENHPNLVKKTNNEDMEFSFTTRDKILRVQIEQELRDKFESKIVDNNKLIETKSRAIFEEMMQRFLNP